MSIAKLKEYDRLYYTNGTSPITDDEYDLLKEEERSKNSTDPYFNQVGAPVRTEEKVKLPYVLGSLNKLKADTVEAWLEKHRLPILASEKADGVSLFIQYRKGEVNFAATHGDSEYGKEITEKARIFCPKIKNDSLMEFRVEAVMLDDKHLKLGKKTARNATAGIINRNDNADAEHITPIFFELLKYEHLRTDTEYERFVLMESLGLQVPEWKLIDEVDVGELM